MKLELKTQEEWQRDQAALRRLVEWAYANRNRLRCKCAVEKGENLMSVEELPGTVFYDVATRRTKKYVDSTVDHWAAGWLFYRDLSGGWAPIRRAVRSDIAAAMNAQKQSLEE